MRTMVTLFCVALLGSMIKNHDCQCRKVEDKETTVWNEKREDVRIVNEEITQLLRGMVRLPDDKPMSDVLVEVFAKSDEQPVRVAACRTGGNGRYCFNKVLAGDYELRFSKVGFKTLCWVVIVAPEDKTKSEEVFPVWMENN